MDMYFDPVTSDIAIDGLGRIKTITTPTEKVLQRLRLRLQIHKGEWAFNTEAYLDWNLLVGRNTRAVVDAHIRDIITSTPGVKGILDFGSAVDAPTRKYTAAFKVLVLDGTVVSARLDQVDNPLPADPGHADAAITSLLMLTVL